MAHEHDNSFNSANPASRVGDLLRELDDPDEATKQLQKDELAHLLDPDRPKDDPAARPAIPRAALLHRRLRPGKKADPPTSVSGTGFSATDEIALPAYMRSVIAEGAVHKAAPEPTAELPVDFLFPGRSPRPRPSTPGVDATEQLDLPDALRAARGSAAHDDALRQRAVLRRLILGLSFLLIAAFCLLLWVLLR